MMEAPATTATSAKGSYDHNFPCYYKAESSSTASCGPAEEEEDENDCDRKKHHYSNRSNNYDNDDDSNHCDDEDNSSSKGDGDGSSSNGSHGNSSTEEPEDSSEGSEGDDRPFVVIDEVPSSSVPHASFASSSFPPPTLSYFNNNNDKSEFGDLQPMHSFGYLSSNNNKSLPYHHHVVVNPNPAPHVATISRFRSSTPKSACFGGSGHSDPDDSYNGEEEEEYGEEDEDGLSGGPHPSGFRKDLLTLNARDKGGGTIVTDQDSSYYSLSSLDGDYSPKSETNRRRMSLGSRQPFFQQHHQPQSIMITMSSDDSLMGGGGGGASSVASSIGPNPRGVGFWKRVIHHPCHEKPGADSSPECERKPRRNSSIRSDATSARIVIVGSMSGDWDDPTTPASSSASPTRNLFPDPDADNQDNRNICNEDDDVSHVSRGAVVSAAGVDSTKKEKSRSPKSLSPPPILLRSSEKKTNDALFPFPTDTTTPPSSSAENDEEGLPAPRLLSKYTAEPGLTPLLSSPPPPPPVSPRGCSRRDEDTDQPPIAIARQYFNHHSSPSNSCNSNNNISIKKPCATRVDPAIMGSLVSERRKAFLSLQSNSNAVTNGRGTTNNADLFLPPMTPTNKKYGRAGTTAMSASTSLSPSSSLSSSSSLSPSNTLLSNGNDDGSVLNEPYDDDDDEDEDNAFSFSAKDSTSLLNTPSLSTGNATKRLLSFTRSPQIATGSINNGIHKSTIPRSPLNFQDEAIKAACMTPLHKRRLSLTDALSLSTCTTATTSTSSTTSSTTNTSSNLAYKPQSPLNTTCNNSKNHSQRPTTTADFNAIFRSSVFSDNDTVTSDLTKAASTSEISPVKSAKVPLLDSPSSKRLVAARREQFLKEPPSSPTRKPRTDDAAFLAACSTPIKSRRESLSLFQKSGSSSVGQQQQPPSPERHLAHLASVTRERTARRTPSWTLSSSIVGSPTTVISPPIASRPTAFQESDPEKTKIDSTEDVAVNDTAPALSSLTPLTERRKALDEIFQQSSRSSSRLQAELDALKEKSLVSSRCRRRNCRARNDRLFFRLGERNGGLSEKDYLRLDHFLPHDRMLLELKATSSLLDNPQQVSSVDSLLESIPLRVWLTCPSEKIFEIVTIDHPKPNMTVEEILEKASSLALDPVLSEQQYVSLCNKKHEIVNSSRPIRSLLDSSNSSRSSSSSKPLSAKRYHTLMAVPFGSTASLVRAIRRVLEKTERMQRALNNEDADYFSFSMGGGRGTTGELSAGRSGQHHVPTLGSASRKSRDWV